LYAYGRIAQMLSAPLSYIIDNISNVEFNLWLDFFNIEHKKHTKNDYYLAQIAYCALKSKDLKITDFLLGGADDEPIKIDWQNLKREMELSLGNGIRTDINSKI